MQRTTDGPANVVSVSTFLELKQAMLQDASNHNASPLTLREAMRQDASNQNMSNVQLVLESHKFGELQCSLQCMARSPWPS